MFTAYHRLHNHKLTSIFPLPDQFQKIKFSLLLNFPSDALFYSLFLYISTSKHTALLNVYLSETFCAFIRKKAVTHQFLSVCGVSLIAWHQQRLGVAVLDTSGEQLAFNLALCGTLHIYSRKSCHTKIMLQRCSTATQSHTTHTRIQHVYIDSRAPLEMKARV